MQVCRYPGIIIVLFLLSACGSHSPRPPGGAGIEQDRAPDFALDPALIRDAVPRRAAVTNAGNKNPYTVLGKTYWLLPTAKGYKARGIASWYGEKFHGRRTSNGEIYSLYGMSAAHKTLPIPCYVKVTNLDNGRSAVVRVNDRGPFHDDRVIDLSYAAAVKLGYAEAGTAPVEIEVIDVDNGGAESAGFEHYLQLGAFSQQALAERLRQRVEPMVSQPVTISVLESQPVFYRVRVGPIRERAEAERVSRHLASTAGTPGQIIVE